eukprot:793347-Pelagomonas_calceolata.AAC.1
MASPLDYNAHYHRRLVMSHYWSSDPRGILFGDHYNSLSSRFSGLSTYHPIHDEKAMKLGLRHAIYSAILNIVSVTVSVTEATATFMLLPA